MMRSLLSGHNISMSDYGPTWATLRTVALSATRKVATSDNLLNLINNAVDQTVNTIINKEGINKPFNPMSYLYLTTLNINISTMFGKSYAYDDPEFNFLKNSFDNWRRYYGRFNIVEHIPMLKPLYSKAFNSFVRNDTLISTITVAKYAEHIKLYKRGIIGDICDGLIEAKVETIDEQKKCSNCLNNENMANVITDIFLSGNLAVNNNLRWITLLLANNLEMQTRMREEIDEMIGDRMATQHDKSRCIYVMAFIMECLRYRPTAPFGIIHRAMCDANIGDHFIAKDTLLSMFIWNVHKNPKYWPNALTFDPKRFITSDGQHVDYKNPAFIPFGAGKRICLAKQFSLEFLFLVIVRLLQKTSGYSIVLPTGDQTANLDPNPYKFQFNTIIPFKIMLKAELLK